MANPRFQLAWPGSILAAPLRSRSSGSSLTVRDRGVRPREFISFVDVLPSLVNPIALARLIVSFRVGFKSGEALLGVEIECLAAILAGDRRSAVRHAAMAHGIGMVPRSRRRCRASPGQGQSRQKQDVQETKSDHSSNPSLGFDRVFPSAVPISADRARWTLEASRKSILKVGSASDERRDWDFGFAGDREDSAISRTSGASIEDHGYRPQFLEGSRVRTSLILAALPTIAASPSAWGSKNATPAGPISKVSSALGDSIYREALDRQKAMEDSI